MNKTQLIEAVAAKADIKKKAKDMVFNKERNGNYQSNGR